MTSMIQERVTMHQPTKFWDRIANRYSKQPVADEAAYQTKLRVTRGYLRPDMKVLEFGCGTGTTAIAHAPYVQHIRAIDISAKMIEIAENKAKEADAGNISFEQAAIDDFDAPSASFDAILGLSILHLVADKEAVMAKVYRMLKPGGVFVSSTVCMDEMMSIWRFVLPVGRFFGLLPMVKFFSGSDLVNSLNASGFEIDHQWQPGKGKAVFIVAKKPVA